VNILAKICAERCEAVAALKVATDPGLLAAQMALQPPPRGFAQAIERADGPALIAEIKRASPSRGPINAGLNPVEVAKAYERGGAACLSVLTEPAFFQGSDADLIAARDTVALPVLRKDFVVDRWQIAQSRAIGADAILLIMAAIDDVMASEFENEAHELGMDVLIETHNEAEIARTLRLASPLIGINNRDLTSFVTDLDVTRRFAPLVPPERTIVSESGIASRADIDRLAGYGARAFLVGASLISTDDTEAAVRALLGQPMTITP